MIFQRKKKSKGEENEFLRMEKGEDIEKLVGFLFYLVISAFLMFLYRNFLAREVWR